MDRAVVKRAELKQAYDKWLHAMSPERVRKANMARIRLRKAGRKYHLINDDRAVAKPKNGYMFYFIEHVHSPDYMNLPTIAKTKAIGANWKRLSASEKEASSCVISLQETLMLIIIFPCRNTRILQRKTDSVTQ